MTQADRILCLEQQVRDLKAELQAVYRMQENHDDDPQRCRHFPKGERCALQRGHEGGCKWGSGD